MPWFLKKKNKHPKLSQKYLKGEIDPDQILIDAKNLPSFDTERLEGRLERPIPKQTLFLLGIFFTLILITFSGKAWALQISGGTHFREMSENNRLRETVVIAERGVITDRNGILLASNVPDEAKDFPLRKYIEKSGFGLLLGYVTYPLKDTSGFYYQSYIIGKDGVEESFEKNLAGLNGLKITEEDATGHVQSESVLEPPQSGKNLTLSVDSSIEHELFVAIKNLAEKVHFTGGSGAIMDVATGEILAITSYPEYDPQILTDGKDTATIRSYGTSAGKPYLDRAVSGLYSPGSIIKPFVAIGALTEKVITPEKQILSTGSISIPNPYDKTKESIFKDWKAHGLVNMREAIAVSSDVYFYEVGGGYKDQRGLGIANLEKYLRLFGFGGETGINLGGEGIGTIPNPAWKEENFPGDQWRIGDTYHTAIGQYGMQVTPIQAVRAIAAIANGGTLLKPTIIKTENGALVADTLPIDIESFQVVREGMRLGVTEGTAAALNIYGLEVAGKTGTAQIGALKQTVNSWVIGFFPYEHPRYAFVVQMEQGPATNLVGAPFVMRQVLEWMVVNTPEYLE